MQPCYKHQNSNPSFLMIQKLQTTEDTMAMLYFGRVGQTFSTKPQLFQSLKNWTEGFILFEP